jgi:hypothetical protein
MQRKTITQVLSIAAMLCAGAFGAEVTSVNVAGYVGKPAAQEITLGEVATVDEGDSLLRQPRLTGIAVRLRDLSFESLDFGTPLLHQYSVHWVKPSKGTLSGLEVAGKPRPLTSREIQNGCVLTEEWGPVPVYFLTVPGDQGNSDMAVCILILDAKQIKALGGTPSSDEESDKSRADGSPAQREKTVSPNRSGP